MKKKFLTVLCIMLLIGTMLGGCAGQTDSDISDAGQSESETAEDDSLTTAEDAEAEDSVSQDSEISLADGVYTVDFDTDSSMFHINEAYDGKATLTVADGEMTVHITLVSKNIVNLYLGLAEDAADHEADWLMPTEDEVTYSDGYTETVYGFDVPVETLNEEFDLAIIGTKGTWYDHRVSVSNPEPEE